MKHLKKNVEVFDRDVEANQGYQYTTNTQYSAIAANKRITKQTVSIISKLDSIYRVIDIGCGDGIYTNEIKSSLPEIEISGFDPAVKAINLAKKKYSTISFYVGNILDEESLGKDTYDLAIIRGVLHHLDYPEIAIKNALKIAPKIIIVDPNGNNPILKSIEKKSAYHREHEEKSYSQKEFESYCANAGGQIKSISYIGFVPFFFWTIPARMIHFFQPFLEMIPLINRYFSAQIVIIATRKH